MAPLPGLLTRGYLLSAATSLFGRMTGSSGKGVDLKIYLEREKFDDGFRLIYARIIFTWYGPQMGNAILETSLEVQADSFCKHLLGFAHGSSLRSDVDLQAE